MKQQYITPFVEMITFDTNAFLTSSVDFDPSQNHGHGNAWGYNNGHHNGHGKGHNPHDNP